LVYMDKQEQDNIWQSRGRLFRIKRLSWSWFASHNAGRLFHNTEC
jgi:hypothetical protein